MRPADIDTGHLLEIFRNTQQTVYLFFSFVPVGENLRPQAFGHRGQAYIFHEQPDTAHIVSVFVLRFRGIEAVKELLSSETISLEACGVVSKNS